MNRVESAVRSAFGVADLTIELSTALAIRAVKGVEAVGKSGLDALGHICHSGHGTLVAVAIFTLSLIGAWTLIKGHLPQGQEVGVLSGPRSEIDSADAIRSGRPIYDSQLTMPAELSSRVTVRRWVGNEPTEILQHGDCGYTCIEDNPRWHGYRVSCIPDDDLALYVRHEQLQSVEDDRARRGILTREIEAGLLPPPVPGIAYHRVGDSRETASYVVIVAVPFAVRPPSKAVERVGAPVLLFPGTVLARYVEARETSGPVGSE